jgi:hypothetical protein
MKKITVKSSLITYVILAMVACTRIPPVQTVTSENFSELEKEYNSLQSRGPVSGNTENSFSAKAITESYLKRKLEKYILPENDSLLLKELLFASFKHPDLARQVCQENKNIYDGVMNSQAVISRYGIDPVFRNFIDSLGTDYSSLTPPEFIVSSTTDNNQTDPIVAMDKEGNFIITWSGLGPGDDNGIFARRFNSDGIPQGNEFLVNTYTEANQMYPAVASDNDGNFIITWSGHGSEDEYGVFARRYNSNGIPQGDQFPVNSFTTDSQDSPRVALGESGNFVIIWTSQHNNFQPDIYARRFNSDGEPEGNEFLVSLNNTNGQYYPKIAMDNKENFAVTWVSNYIDPSNYDVYVRRFDSTGSGIGSEFRVNVYTESAQDVTSIAMDDSGDFVVAWTSYGQDGGGFGAHARRFNSNGEALGSEFRANTYTTGDQDFPEIAMDAAGDFVISWVSTQDGDAFEIYARRYNSLGDPVSPEFRVNSISNGDQYSTAVAMDAAGDFIITWRGPGQSGYDSFAQRYNRFGRRL